MEIEVVQEVIRKEYENPLRTTATKAAILIWESCQRLRDYGMLDASWDDQLLNSAKYTAMIRAIDDKLQRRRFK